MTHGVSLGAHITLKNLTNQDLEPRLSDASTKISIKYKVS